MRISDEAADRELERQVVHYLDTSHRPGLRRLAVQAKHGEVTLTGQVATFHERQLALCHSRRVDGVLNLVDRIEVSR